MGHPVEKIHLSKLMLFFDPESKNVTFMVIGLNGYKCQTKNKPVRDLSVAKYKSNLSVIMFCKSAREVQHDSPV